MGAKDYAILLLTHPIEFKTLIQFSLYYRANGRDISDQKQWPTTRWNHASMRRCWELLDMTSRSFAAVVKEVEGELARTVSLILMLHRLLLCIRSSYSMY
jgi:farnesyl-diphosphate farnesyltransferase